MDVFRSVKRPRMEDVFSGGSVFAFDTEKSKHTPYFLIKDGSTVEKCRGFSEWRVRAPVDITSTFNGVLYATFDSLECALAYEQQQQSLKAAADAAAATQPDELEDIVSTDVDLNTIDLSTMFGVISCDEEIAQFSTSPDWQTQRRTGWCMSPLTLPSAMLQNCSTDPHPTPNAGPAGFHIRNVDKTRTPSTKHSFLKTFSHTTSGEFATPFLYNSMSFKFSPHPASAACKVSNQSKYARTRPSKKRDSSVGKRRVRAPRRFQAV